MLTMNPVKATQKATVYAQKAFRLGDKIIPGNNQEVELDLMLARDLYARGFVSEEKVKDFVPRDWYVHHVKAQQAAAKAA